METININGDEYISLNEAESYLDDPNAILKLESWFYRYKGFATCHDFLAEPVLETCDYSAEEAREIYREMGRDIYINGVFEINARLLIQLDFNHGTMIINDLYSFLGSIDRSNLQLKYNETISIPSTPLSLKNGSNYNNNILVKVSDLDALAEKHGIPKKAPETPSQPHETTEDSQQNGNRKQRADAKAEKQAANKQFNDYLAKNPKVKVSTVRNIINNKLSKKRSTTWLSDNLKPTEETQKIIDQDKEKQ